MAKVRQYLLIWALCLLAVGIMWGYVREWRELQARHDREAQKERAASARRAQIMAESRRWGRQMQFYKIAMNGDVQTLRDMLAGASADEMEWAWRGAGGGGRLENVRLLLDTMRSSRRLTREDCDTLLNSAALYGYTDIAALALKNGAHPNGRGKGHPPLALAASAGHVAVARLLLDAGADVNARVSVKRTDSDYGMTPLMLAARSGYPNMVRLLLSRKADIHARTPSGRTVLQVAKEDLKPIRLPPGSKVVVEWLPKPERSQELLAAANQRHDRAAAIKLLEQAGAAE
jgi:hypothetical protein